MSTDENGAKELILNRAVYLYLAYNQKRRELKQVEKEFYDLLCEAETIANNIYMPDVIKAAERYIP